MVSLACFYPEAVVVKRVRRVWLDRAKANMPLLDNHYWGKGFPAERL
jgi:hypothetical protein